MTAVVVGVVGAVDACIAIKWYFQERGHDARLVTADARMARAARTIVAEVELVG